MVAEKPLIWVGSSKHDLLKMPEEVIDTFGYALDLAQKGITDPVIKTKALTGLGSGVVEIVESDEAGTYRAVYAAKLERAIYVLHAFMKKSKSGIAHPKPDVELIRKRLKDAQALDKEARDDRA